MELMASRGYFFCGYCGSFHFPETKADDGIRILGEPSRRPFLRRVRSAPRLGDARRNRTHSMLVKLPRLLDRAQGLCVEWWRSGAPGRPGRPLPPFPSIANELERKVRCPGCAGPMTSTPILFSGPGNVVIDSCARCELVWLDFGELRQIADAPRKGPWHTPGRPTFGRRADKHCRGSNDWARAEPGGRRGADLLDSPEKALLTPRTTPPTSRATRMTLIVLILMLSIVATPELPSAAQDCRDWRDCRQLALDAAARQDFSAFHDLAWRTLQAGPKRDPALMTMLARAQSLSGRPPMRS